MAILATLFGALGRFAGRLLTAALGWASTLLFGRVPQDRQIVLVLITFGSVVWIALLVGVVLPDVGTFLLAAMPVPSFVDETVVRLVMLAAALVIPAVIGVLTLFVSPPERRPKGTDALVSVLRGYPLALVLAVVLVFLAVVGTVRKLRALIKRWSDAHVAIVVRERGYDQMVDDLERALDTAGLDVTEGDAPAILATPARLLGAVAGPGVRALVPDRLVQLRGPDLEVQLYPSDVAIAGKPSLVTRARAAIASRLVATTAFLTTAAESQAVEDRLRRIADAQRWDPRTQEELARIDDVLSHLEVPYEEWEVLYRMRLQVERDLLTGREPGAVPGQPPGSGGRPTAELPGSPAPIEGVLAAGLIGLLVLDLALALRDRTRQPS